MLVGRDTECAQIESLLTTARAGTRAALVVHGEAGIGKTSLLDYAADRAADTLVVRAVGVRGEADVSFAGLLELTRPLLSHLDRVPPPQARALRVALALEDARDGELDRFAVAAGLLSLLATAAEERVVLVLVDDLQWLDRASAEATVFAARRLADDPVAFLFAVRDGEEPPVDLGGLSTMPVTALDRAATEALAAALHGDDLTPEIAAAVFAVTGGNPLAVCELRDIDALALPTGAAPVSRLIETAYGARAASLDDRTHTALVVLAADDAVTVPILHAALAALGISPDVLGDAERAGLVAHVDGRVRFRHPLVRSAVFQQATPADRRRAHAALAVALAAHGDRDRRVLHRAAATIGPDSVLAGELHQLATAAIANHAYATAAVVAERGAALATPSQRSALLYTAGRARWLAGERDRASPLLDAALRESPPSPLRADIQRIRARMLHHAGHVAEAIDLLVSEGRRLTPTDGERAATLFEAAAEVAVHTGVPAIAIAAAEEAVRIRGGSAPSQRIGMGLCLDGRYDEAVPIYESIIAAVPDDDPDALSNGSDVAGWLGRYDLAYRFAVRALEVARAHGSPSAAAKAAQVALDQALVAGEFAAAAAYGEEGVALSLQTGQELVTVWCHWSLGILAAFRGDEAGLADALGGLELFGRPVGFGAIHDCIPLIRGLALLGRGDPRAAADVFAGGIDLDAEQVGNAPFVGTFELIEALVRAGDTVAAEQALERVAGHAHQPWAVAALHRCRGMLATEAEGDALFRTALEISERHQAARELEHARLLYGEWLRRRRRRIDAREQLRAALGGFERMGANPWAALALRELAATGETHAIRREGRPVNTLTPQEFRVASMAADGLANRDIAQRLFLSPKTVEAHLHRAFVKLGVDRRGDLGRALEDDGARPT